MSSNSVNNTLNRPQIVGYMSVDVSRNYFSDLSQLKFLNSIPNSRIHLDLNHKINEAVKRTTDENNEKISLMLKFIVNNYQYLNLNKAEYTFITYRRTLISVMCNAFSREHVRIGASLFNGSIYLCSLETPSELQRRKSRSRQEDRFCAWGYKFEQYMLSDLPNIPPDVEKPVIENEEFSLYYQSRLGEHELLYGAQIDGLLATNGTVSLPAKIADYETNLNYLKNNTYVELKTNREIQYQRQEQNFKKHKLLRCWCQCYLADLNGLLVGFRDDNGIVTNLHYFNTDDIPTQCQHEWQPTKAIKYLDNFLSYVKNTFKDRINKGYVYHAEPLSFVFDLHGSSNYSIQVSENNSKEDAILPSWYLEAMINKM